MTGAVTWVYDTGNNGIGRLTQMTDASGNTAFSYDRHSRSVTKTQVVNVAGNSFSQALHYQYNAYGQLTRVTYPSGTQVDTTYGADGRPTEIRINGTVLMQNIAYRPFGPPKSWNWGNNQTHRRNFDLDGRLTQYPLGSGTQTLTYDAAGRITHTIHTNPVYDRGFSYDALDRLIGQSDSTSYRLWTYDANSNRTSVQSGSNVYPTPLIAATTGYSRLPDRRLKPIPMMRRATH